MWLLVWRLVSQCEGPKFDPPPLHPSFPSTSTRSVKIVINQPKNAPVKKNNNGYEDDNRKEGAYFFCVTNHPYHHAGNHYHNYDSKHYTQRQTQFHSYGLAGSVCKASAYIVTILGIWKQPKAKTNWYYLLRTFIVSRISKSCIPYPWPDRFWIAL